MLYLVSDIHGNYKKLKKLLQKIDFDSQKDKMIILGDVLDRGSDGIEIIKYIKPMVNAGVIEMLLGNHELFCIRYLEGTLDAKLWSAFGGEKTLQTLDRMSNQGKQELNVFLKSLPIYTEYSSKHLGDFICTHTGLHADYLVKNNDGTINVGKSIEVAFKEDGYNFMCGRDLHYLPNSDLEALDKYLIVGHVPCDRLREDMNDCRFIRTNYYMDIDSGCGHGGKLGCYIVDTDKEVYV